MIICLTGFMGCGKSSVGRRLSQLLCCPFMDLDDMIVESAGRSIPEIFASEGEAGFRRMELETLKEILSTSEPRQCALTPIENLDCHHGASSCHHGASSCHPERSEGSINLVLALGGGTVMTPECAEIVKERTCCIYLKASIDTLMEHLSGEADGRPMLNGETLYERINVLMAQRSATYEKTAHVIIDTDGKSVEAIASEIFRLLNI